MKNQSLFGETAIDALERQGDLLEAVCKTVSSLLSTYSWESSLCDAFATLVKALDVSWIGMYQYTEGASGNNDYSLVTTSSTLDKDSEHCNINLWEKFCRFPNFALLRGQLQTNSIITGCARDDDCTLQELMRDSGVLSILAIPVPVNQMLWGFIALDDCKIERNWTKSEITALTLVANELGATIRRTRAEKIRSATLRISEAAHLAENLDTLFGSIHRIVDELMPAKNFYIALYDPVEDLISFPYDVDEYDEHFPPQKPGRGLTEYVLRSRKPLLATPKVFGELVRRGEVDLIGCNSIDWIGVPLPFRDNTSGVLAIQSYTEGVRYTQEDVEILTFVSTQAAMAIERRRADDSRRQSDERYRLLVENIPIGIYKCVFDSHGSFMMANPAFMEIFGINNEEDLKSLKFIDLCTSASDWQTVEDILKSGREINDLQLQLKKLDGSPLWVSLTARIEQGNSGRDLYINGALENITIRVQRSQEREALISFATILHMELSRNELIKTVLTYLTIYFQLESIILIRYDSQADQLFIEGARGFWDYLSDKHIPLNTAFVSQVVNSRRPLLMGWLDHDPIFQPSTALGESQMIAGIPITTENRAVGAIWVGRQAAIQGEHMELLVAMGDMLANALERTILQEKTQQRVQRLSALRAVDMAISTTLDLRLVLNVLLDQLRSQIGIDAASILLRNRQVQTVEYAAGKGFITNSISQTRIHLSDRLVGRTILNGRSVHISNLSVDGGEYIVSRGLSSEGFKFYYATPLMAKGQLVGVMELFHRALFDMNQDWVEFFEMLAGQAAIAIDNATLFDDLQRSNMDLHLSYDTTLESWVNALDIRLGEGAHHSRELVEWTIKLACAMMVPDNDIIHIRRGALLHDIGNMLLPDAILLKDGELNPEERMLVNKHPLQAKELLSSISFLKPATVIPLFHHERWDGSGYPNGLEGSEIPLAARIFAVVDVWDALRSNRPYRNAWNEDAVQNYLRQQAGILFDPEITRRYLELLASI